MNYTYKVNLSKLDMWLYYMVDRYSGMAGIVQIIFTVSMILLISSKWDILGPVMRFASLLGASLFTIIQPFIFYTNASNAVDRNTPDTIISFSEQEMSIIVIKHEQIIPYSDIVRVMKKPFMIIIQPDLKHIYILTDRILGNTKNGLYEFLRAKITG